MSSVLLPIVLGVIGFLVGPFVGLIVDRAVDRESPEPFLRCAACRASLGRRSLLPLQAWTTRCENGHRNWRYPVVDVAMAGMYVVTGLRFGTSWQLIPYLVFFTLLIAMSVIDAETKLLLNVLTYPTLFAGLFAVLALSGPNGFDRGIAPALWAAGFYFGFMLLAHVLPRLMKVDALGLGDVKLAPSLGLFIGWMTDDVFLALGLTIWASIIGFTAGGVIGALLKRSRKAEVPLGPFIAAGAAAVILATTPAALGAG